MAIAKIVGGDSAKIVKLHYKRTSPSGTKNLAQHNTFSHLARLERDVAEGKLTEDDFAEQQSDILTAFVDQWGDPTPSSETDEQRQARRERKACQKAEEDKERVMYFGRKKGSRG